MQFALLGTLITFFTELCQSQFLSGEKNNYIITSLKSALFTDLKRNETANFDIAETKEPTYISLKFDSLIYL